jgi:hypothetical protein
LHLFIILLPCVWFEHPGHTYGGFVPYFSERGVTKTSMPCHRDAAMMTTPSAPPDFLESRIGWSVPLASTICTSRRMVCSSTSKASSRMKCHPPTWLNNISMFLGCSICNHEWSVRSWTCCMVDEQLTIDVWWTNNVWWSWTLYGGWTYRCMMPFGTYYCCKVDEVCMMDNRCIYG